MIQGRARVLYAPYESGDLGQRGPRRALGGLLDAKLVEDVRIFSLKHRVRTGDGPFQRAEFLQIAREFKPNIVLLDKPTGTGLEAQDILALRTASDFAFVVLDMDPYHWWFKPLSALRNSECIDERVQGAAVQ